MYLYILMIVLGVIIVALAAAQAQAASMICGALGTICGVFLLAYHTDIVSTYSYSTINPINIERTNELTVVTFKDQYQYNIIQTDNPFFFETSVSNIWIQKESPVLRDRTYGNVKFKIIHKDSAITGKFDNKQLDE